MSSIRRAANVATVSSSSVASSNVPMISSTPFRVDDLVDVYAPTGDVVIADGVLTSLTDDNSRAVLVVLNSFLDQMPAVNGIDASKYRPGESIKVRSSVLVRKPWRETLDAAIERQIEHVDLGRYFYDLNIFPVEIFALQQRIRKLELNLDSLSEIPDEISYLENLEELNLAHNQITRLPNGFTQLQRLQILDLRDNGLLDLPEDIGNMSSLHTLYVQDNKLRHLPPSIGLMNAIENLYLNNNMLLDVPDEMGDAISLCLVNLRGNKKLRDLPQSFGHLQRLWWLGLDPGFAGVPLAVTDNPRYCAEFVRTKLVEVSQGSL